MKITSLVCLLGSPGLAGAFAPSIRAPSVVGRQTTQRFASNYEFALLFDCDGVILETEELHRLAYNAAFKAADLTIDGEPVEWSVEYYDVLQNTVGGGKPKMFFHFRNTTGQFPMVGDKAAPATLEEQQSLIDDLQAHKTNIYRDFIEEKAVPRPGVIELMVCKIGIVGCNTCGYEAFLVDAFSLIYCLSCRTKLLPTQPLLLASARHPPKRQSKRYWL